MKIIVPTDFSETSYNANLYAVELAKAIKAEVIYFHAYHFPITDPLSPAYGVTGNIVEEYDVMEEHEKRIKNNLINYCIEVNTKTKNKVKCDFILKPGFLSDVLIETIQEINAKLVIMGTHGSSGVNESIFGSNTTTVLPKSPIPVMAIPNKVTFKTANRIIYATDNHDAAIKNIQTLLNIFKPIQPKVFVVHIEKSDHEEENRQFEKMIREHINYSQLDYKIYINDDVIDGISNAVDELDAGVVSMTNRKKGFFAELFNKSLTKKMIYHTTIPLLAFNE